MPNQDRAASVYPITVRELTVSRVRDVTPALRRVTLTGPELDAFTDAEGRAWPPFSSTGFDDDIRLVFPYPGESSPVLPLLRDGGIRMPEGRRPVWRVYTVRRHDAAAGELEVEFVRHGVGIATTWAYRVAPGDRVHVVGPAASLALPAPPDRLLVAGDDTALPAIARFLDSAPDDLRADVLIEIAEEDHRVPVREPAGVEITWIVRGGEGADAGSLLADHLRRRTEAPGWDATGVAGWLAGEQSVVRDLRRLLVGAGVDRRRIDFTGYWKRGEVATLDSDPRITDEERNAEAFDTFHEQAELLPPLAIRAAAALGLGELVAEGVVEVGALAQRTGADVRALEKLLRYLVSIGILDRTLDGTPDGGEARYGLTHTGHFLTEEFVLDVLHPDGIQARRHQGLFGLEHAVRTGGAGYAAATGRDYARVRAEETFAGRLLEGTAQFADYVAAPVAGAQALHGIDHLVVHSDAAVAAAAAVVARHPRTRVTIVARPSDASWTRAALPGAIPDPDDRARTDVVVQTVAEPTPDADAILFGKVLDQFPDAEAAHILRRAAASLTTGGRILLVEDTLDETELDEHEAEEDLLALVLHGTGRRTVAELDGVVADAGLRTSRVEVVGWGDSIRSLVPAEERPPL